MRRLKFFIHEDPQFSCQIEGWVAAAVIGGAVIGGAATVIGSNEQAKGAENAANTQKGMYEQQLQNEQPYVQSGNEAMSQLNYLEGNGTPGQGQTGTSSSAGGFGSLNAPFTTSMMQQYSPAYQFQLQQGQQGTINGAANTQGGLSGAAQAGLEGYNQSFANTAFNNAFNQYQTQQSNTYSRLAGVANLGQAAASNQATGGSNYASSIGSSETNVGTAYGSGTASAGSSVGSGIGSAALLGALYGGGVSSTDAATLSSSGLYGSGSSGLISAGGGYVVNTPGWTG
jgi:hypothetical protein